MIRLIVVAAIVWLVISLIRRSLAGPSPREPAPPAATAMHACRYCRVNVPETECVRSQGHYFCSEAHRDAWHRDNP